MKVCVYGAGAVGGHMAVRFTKAGADVSVIARGAHGTAIRERGLVLLRGEERLEALPRCVENSAELPIQDIVVATVKGPALASVASGLAPLLGPKTRVIFAMNGIPWWFGDGAAFVFPQTLVDKLDRGGHLRRVLSPDQIVGCAIHSANIVMEPGIVRNTTVHRNRMVLGCTDDRVDEQVMMFADMARRAGYECELSSNIRQTLWVKALLSISASPISALTGTTMAGIVRDSDLRMLAINMMREGIALGRKLGFEIEDNVEAQLDFNRGIETKPSMLQDLEAGKTLEIDNAISAFREIAAAIKFPAPALDIVGSLLVSLAEVRGLRE